MFTSKIPEESSIIVDSGHNPKKKWQNLTNLSNEFGILMKINGGDDTGHTGYRIINSVYTARFMVENGNENDLNMTIELKLI